MIFPLKLTAEQLCSKYANGTCGATQDFLNFYKFYWCTLGGELWIFLPLVLVFVFFIFKYTGMSVEEYIAEGITKLSKAFGFSDSLSAVTLLALANGAGDVITALVASGAEGGVSYNIGALYGAGLFVCSMVIGICLIQSPKPFVFDPSIIYRDVGYYILATFATIGFAFYKFITWWSSLILLGIYAALVITVLIQDNIKKNGKSNASVTEGTMNFAKNDVKQRLTDPKEDDEKEELVDEDRMPSDVNALTDALNPLANLMLAVGNRPKEEELAKTGGMAGLISAFQIATLAKVMEMKMQYHKEQRKKEAEKRTAFETVIHFAEKPFEWVLYLTVLPCDEEQYTKARCLIYPVTGLYFSIFVVMRELNQTFFVVWGSSAVVVGLAFFLLLNEKPPSWFLFMNFLGVLGGLMWSYVLIGILIDLLGAVGVLLNLDTTYLGLTILAVGNALPDALTSIALCKTGAGQMAISGAYAGQLFGLLIGFGISMLKLTLQEGNQAFDLFDFSKLSENLLDLLVIGTALIVLSATFIYGVSNNFIMKKSLAFFLIATYVVFILVSTSVAVYHASKTY